jgi:hypothetical protein
MNNLDFIACLQAALGIFLAGNDVSVYLNSNALRPETKLGHQIR